MAQASSARCSTRAYDAEETPSDRTLRSVIRAILFAQTTPCPLDDMAAHRQAVATGPRLVPWLHHEIAGRVGPDQAEPVNMGMVTALALAARDIDEDGTREFVSRLRSRRRRSHRAFINRLSAVADAFADTVRAETDCGPPVLVSTSLDAANDKAIAVRRWLDELPCRDLDGIRRVVVLPRMIHKTWGIYVEGFATVSLVWRGPETMTWWSRRLLRFVLFHGVGHHVHRAADPVDRSGADLRAEEYALRHLAKSDPLARGVGGKLVVAFSRTSLGVRSAPDPA